MESLVSKEMIIEIASSDVLKEKVNSVLVLKHEIHAENEWVIGLEENVLFVLRILDLVLVYQNVFVDSLHCIHSPRLLINYQEHLSK